MRNKCKKFEPGFTLIECIFAMLLLGLAVAGLMVANQSLTVANGAGMEIANAQFCVDQIREMMAPMTVSNVLTYNNKTYSPPIDSTGTAMTNLPGYSETIAVENVNIGTLQPPATGSPIYRITVTVSLHGVVQCSTSWFRTVY